MTDNNIRRHQVEDREKISDLQKDAIAQKSDHRCVWCGEKVYFGYQGTLDHFVPLKKGGTNDDENLVMMCYDCNQKKGSRLIPPNIAAKHLKEPHLSKLCDYFEEYLDRYDYLSRGNLLACDVYEVRLVNEVVSEARRKAYKRGKKLNIASVDIVYHLVRAYPDDVDKVVEFYTNYLRKYDMLYSEEAALNNIKFWMRFGVIYFIERNGQISSICTAIMNKTGYLSLNVFTPYSTRLSKAVTLGMAKTITEALMRELDIPELPIALNFIKTDPLAYKIYRANENMYSRKAMISSNYFIQNEYFDSSSEDKIDAGKERFKKFLARFADCEDQINLYLYQNDMLDYTWMADEVLEVCQLVREEDVNMIDSIKDSFSKKSANR